MDASGEIDDFDAEVIERRREISDLTLERGRKREMLKAINANHQKAEGARVRALRNGGFDSIADRDAFELKKQAQAMGRAVMRLDREIADRSIALDEFKAKVKAERRALHRANVERAAVGMRDHSHKRAIGLAFAVARAVADCDYILASRLVAQIDEVKPTWRDESGPR